jgi:hypothetical protein
MFYTKVNIVDQNGTLAGNFDVEASEVYIDASVGGGASKLLPATSSLS